VKRFVAKNELIRDMDRGACLLCDFFLPLLAKCDPGEHVLPVPISLMVNSFGQFRFPKSAGTVPKTAWFR
jgi:hypothetical protein